MKKGDLFLFGFILLKFVLQYLLIDPSYDLHRDEYLHLDQAHHLAWGYISVPPVTSWFSYLIYLLGNTEFWVKFFPALFGALTITLIWKAIERLGGSLYAQSLAAICLIFSALARLNILFQPNSFDILAWTFVFYSLLSYIKTGKNKWLYWLGVGVGFGFLNKYNIAFQVLGLIPALFLTSDRKIFKNPNLYGAFGLAFLIALPNLIWQLQNDFPVLWHMRMLSKYQLVNVNRLDFLTEQFFFFFGSSFVLILAFVSYFQHPSFRKYQVFFWTTIFTLAIFTFFRAKNYYAIGLYPIHFAFGAIYISHVLSKSWGKYLKPVAMIIPISLFVVSAPMTYPIGDPEYLKGVQSRHPDLMENRWEDGEIHDLPQDFADMLGWKELAEKVDLAYSKAPSDEYTVIICDNYGQAGAINFYTKTKGLQAVTMNADYVNWIDLSGEIKNVILVREVEDGISEREISLFEKSEKIGSITDPNAREFGTSIHLLLGAKTDINAILAAEIEEKRMELKTVN
ncbi:glycosyltransferase family 39 protein [Algoriphagus winogradskyi]|uniref:Dolichyl-phosphate-mannose-protein mannosyltransferase n=1 Tax=Algoriphagus winogradskyi TaxID=237017 RepID=A0ABY1P095_9BACT|nr:glycosyltransferase family 39 protein [Algoriphagus winogradskyi]SMP21910.1 Dolichyl-phosphate-mannose-protein mannosyltransferase [Algoriphagus winogradskyi]